MNWTAYAALHEFFALCLYLHSGRIYRCTASSLSHFLECAPRRMAICDNGTFFRGLTAN
ncbi:hypothetical protein ASZ90_010148 [hydrocarbon metagenome]|uniref:Uncharacterized protein n=1 Tax=hydrocarbon metagenome TaxID=938273 RepID=A0A0W8FGU9_9ZZZZ